MGKTPSQQEPDEQQPSPEGKGKEVAPALVAALAVDLACTNPECPDYGKVIETVTIEDFNEGEGIPKDRKTKIEPDPATTYECDRCDTRYRVPALKVLY